MSARQRATIWDAGAACSAGCLEPFVSPWAPGLVPLGPMPSLHSPGTRERRRAYVLSTTSRRYAVLPMRDGRLLLLGVEQPEALVTALRDEAGRRR